MPNPAPQRQRQIVFPTPNVNDFLFHELVDAQLIADEKTDIPEYGTKHPDTKKWPNHRLVHVRAADEQNNFYRFYYASDQIGQDDDNWEHSQADIGGTRFDAVSRTYVIRRSEYNPEVPAQGAAMPDEPASKFTGTYVLAERRQSQISDEILAGLYVIERRSYVEKTQLVGIMVNEIDNESRRATLDYYFRGEIVTGSTTVEDLFNDPSNAYWDAYTAVVGGKTTYYRREGKQRSSNWFTIETVPIMSGNDNGDGSLTVQDYFTSQNYTWPSVLENFSERIWPKRAGGEWRVTEVDYKHQRYSGPCKARVKIDWSPNEFSDVVPDQPPLPTPIVIVTPYFNISVPACLHPRIPEEDTLLWTNGTTDPIFEYVGVEYLFEATNYTDWGDVGVGGLKITDIQEPAKGGWIRRRVWVFPPDDLTPAS